MSNKFTDKRTLDYIWKRLSAWATGSENASESPWNQPSLIIDEPMTVYVETTGSDSSLTTGSASQPFRTIQGALNFVKRFVIAAPVTIQVGAGTFDGFVMGDQQFDSSAAIPSLTIMGSFAETTVATGTASGVAETLTSTVLTDNDQTWTVDDLKGKFLCLTGTTNGLKPSGTKYYFPIISNTATAVTVNSTNAMGTALNNNYQIVEHSTAVSQNMVSYSTTTGTNTVCASINGTTGIGQSYILNGLKFNGTSSVSVRTFGGASVRIEQCHFSMAAGATGLGLGGGGFNVSACLFKQSGTTGTAISVSGVLVNTTTSSGTIPSGSMFWGAGGANTQTGVFIGTNVGRIGISSHFEGYNQAIQCGTSTAVSSGTLALSSLNLKDCTTGVQLFGPGTLATTSSLTATNVTNGVVIGKGAKAQFASSVAAFGTTELSVDGSTGTFATMRSNSPKVFPLTPNAYGSYVYE